MTLPDALLINGTNIESLSGIVVADYSGLLAPGRRRGENLTIPGRHGEIGVSGRPFAAYTFDVPISVLPDDLDGSEQARRAEALDNLQGIADLCVDGIITLGRRWTLSDSTYATHHAAGEYLDGLAMEFLNVWAGRTILQFKNLSGCWFDEDEEIVIP